MTFSFNVMTSSGQRIAISVLGADDKVSDIKAKLYEMEGIPQSMICLVHAGRKLIDQNTLEASGIRAGVTINMIQALRAG